jgi:predicted hydrocarbon binding protein
MTGTALHAMSLVAMPPRALHTLRDRVGAQALQEAGYAAGEATFRSFAAWLPGAAGVDHPSEVAAPKLAEALTRFFAELGWGSVDVTAMSDAVLALDSRDWPEAQPGAGLQYPSCFYSSGLLADFMSRVGDTALAVMEVECRSRGDERCRWLLGSPDTLTALYQHLAQGADYRTVLGAGA